MNCFLVPMKWIRKPRCLNGRKTYRKKHAYHVYIVAVVSIVGFNKFIERMDKMEVKNNADSKKIEITASYAEVAKIVTALNEHNVKKQDEALAKIAYELMALNGRRKYK